MTDKQQIQGFLSTFRAHLGSTPLPEREEMVREMAAHIRDAAEEPGVSLNTVLARLGPPEELARQYGDGVLLQRARGSLSPLLLLQATLRLATKGISGLLIFCCAVSGYVTGAGMILSAFAKPFFPNDIGMWRASPHVMTAGAVLPHGDATQEILGWWYIPVALVLGALLIVVTTLIVRGCLWVSARADKLSPRLRMKLEVHGSQA